MGDDRAPSNGDPLKFREFDAHSRLNSEAHEAMSRRIERNDHRIDKIESWRDRVAGPVAVLLAILAIVATGSNVLVIWLGLLS